MFSTLKRRIPLRFPPRRLYHHFQGWQAAAYYGFPAHQLKLIGITGTNGKTTSSLFTASILKAANLPYGLLSTLYIKTGPVMEANPTKFTTLAPHYLQKQLRTMISNQLSWVVMEVTSHALDQGRVNGIPFDIVALTNVTHEHLDYHGTMAAYRQAKSRLFADLAHSKRKSGTPKIAVLDASLPEFTEFDQFPADCKYYYGLEKIELPHRRPSDGWLYTQNLRSTPEGNQFDLVTANGTIPVTLTIPGPFNVKNALLAAAIGLALRLDLETIKTGLEAVKGVPGRLEWVQVPANRGFKVMIDYAVTPDSLTLLHDLVRTWYRGRLIQVFGACGDRDRSKRPIMGKIVGQNADLSILTNEDPYGENPQQIIDELEVGLEQAGGKRDKDYLIIMDRAAAIQKAISLAKKGDLVLVTGKGAETLMQFADRSTPWSDRVEIEKALAKL